jgi:hypothetical protein
MRNEYRSQLLKHDHANINSVLISGSGLQSVAEHLWRTGASLQLVT